MTKLRREEGLKTDNRTSHLPQNPLPDICGKK
jgi:hypothetical protein